MKFLPLLLHAVSVMSTSDSMSLIPDMSRYCPYSETCRRPNDTSKDLLETTHPMGPCCTDCSCDDDCVDNCCFPKPGNKDRSHQECFYLTTKQPPRAKKHLYRSFYVVTMSPQDGCVCRADLPKKHESNPWKNLSPVSSAESGRIYKDLNLAKCFCEQDVIPWLSVIVCDNFHQGTYLGYDLLTDPEIMKSHEKFCRVQFYYPGNEEDIRSEECHKNLTDTCDESFSIPVGQDMSKTDIVSACESGFFSPYTYNGQYANVFCYICNGQFFSKFKQCIIKGIDRDGMTSMMGFLNSKFQNTNILKSLERKAQRKACPTQTSKLSTCRDILCPEGRIRITHGTCVATFTAFGTRRYYITLSLTPFEPITVSDIEKYRGPKHLRVFPEWIKSPWPDVWRVNIMSYVVGDGSYPLVELVVVNLFIDALNTTFETVMNDVGKLITETWEMKLGNATIEFQQSFCPRENNMMNAGYFDIFTDHSRSKTERREMRILYSDDHRAVNPFYITKRFLCEQVKLEDDEYTLTDRRLILNRTGRIHLNFEFSQPLKLGRDPSVRICLADSGLIENDSGSPLLIGSHVLILILTAHICM